MTETENPKLQRILGAGIGDPWLAWNAKIDRLPHGAVVLDHLSRADWPGDDAGWDRFVELQDRARRLCNADTGAGWQAPQEPPPPRIPAGEWRGLSQLEQSPQVDQVGVWVSDWHANGGDVWRGLLFVGPVGTGKTAICAALAYDTDPHAFWSTTALIDWLLDGYRTNAFGHRFDTLAKRRLLILDDLGTERDTDGQVDLVVKLIEARHRHRRLTVISTNLRTHLRTARYGQRIESRLTEMCEVVPMPGDDRRVAA